MSVKFFFGYQYDDENQITTEIVCPPDVRYEAVASQFFRFLSSAYGYDITAKDVIDENLSDTRLSD